MMRIKICGMTEQPLVDRAAELGADMCGLVFHAPSPRCITPERAAGLNTHGMARVGVFVRQDPWETARIARTARLDYVQLHGGQGVEFADFLPRERIIRVLLPGQFRSAGELQDCIGRFADSCGIYLLDAGMGSGTTLDWNALRGLEFPHPWFLSGGLGPGSISRALSILSPDGLDLNSRLESAPGRKDPALMEAAVLEARRH